MVQLGYVVVVEVGLADISFYYYILEVPIYTSISSGDSLGGYCDPGILLLHHPYIAHSSTTRY